MKLGVSINYWDCGELLIDCIANIQPYADHISIVFQLKSNYGQDMAKRDYEVLKYIRENVLVNQIIRAERPETDPIGVKGEIIGGIHETRKRNIGLELARKAGCTHYMSMDADEFYTAKNFEFLMQVMCSGKDKKGIFTDGYYDVVVCQMQTYYKSPFYRITPPEEYYVPVIYKIKPELKFTAMPAENFRVLVDPSRRCVVKRTYTCTRDEAQMHHMSYVRRDLGRKLYNSSAHLNHEPDELKKCIEWYVNYKYPAQAILIGKELTYADVELVPNFFNLK